MAEDHAGEVQRHHGRVSAACQPPVRTGRLKFRADLLLHLARNAGPRF
jgi:hypothetical protein